MQSLPNDDASYSTVIIIKKSPKTPTTLSCDISKMSLEQIKEAYNEYNKIRYSMKMYGVNLKLKTGPKCKSASHKKRVNKAWFEKRAQERREIAEAEHRIYKQGIKTGIKVLNQTV